MTAELDEDDAGSLKSHLKFLCSYGGKTLPRPTDGHLKYVGGETRVVAVPRSITFSELKEKIDGMFNAEVVMKYRVMPEDLDTLVSVRSDEDLRHMLDEYDRRPRSPIPAASPRFRLYLFSPSTAAPASSLPREGHVTLEQRYIDAVNGDGPVPTAAAAGSSRIHMFALSSSANTSPTSTVDHRGGGGMHRVRSTPNLSGSRGPASNGVGSPRCHSRPHKYSAAYGGCGAQLMGAAVPYGVCGCRCSMVVGHQPQPKTVRRYYYCPAAAGPIVGGGECVCCGHVDEAGVPRSGQGFHLAGGGCVNPPKPTWE